MMSLTGSGDLQTGPDPDGPWQANRLTSDRSRPLQQRWISIPQNTWHQPVVPAGDDWVVVSFHTVPAEELIEERPAANGDPATRQKRYIS